MNLRGADLSELDLGCDIKLRGFEFPEDPVFTERLSEASCADFTGADLTGAQIDGTDLTGAYLINVTLRDIDAIRVSAAGARIEPRDMSNVKLSASDLRGAQIIAGEGAYWNSPRAFSLSLVAAEMTAMQISGRGPSKQAQLLDVTSTSAE